MEKHRLDFFLKVGKPSQEYFSSLENFVKEQKRIKLAYLLALQASQLVEPGFGSERLYKLAHKIGVLINDYDRSIKSIYDMVNRNFFIGRKIVAIGGRFSSGKSSLVNLVVGEKIQTVAIHPTTSVPTYICNGSEEKIIAVNCFQDAVAINNGDFATLNHDENEDFNSKINELVQSITIQTPVFQWKNLALLDTPGYNSQNASLPQSRTDEVIALECLNSANYIIWMIPVSAGVINEDEIVFLKKLNPKIPKIILLSKADIKTMNDIDVISDMIKSQLIKSDISYIEIMAVSCRKSSSFSMSDMFDFLSQWDASCSEHAAKTINLKDISKKIQEQSAFFKSKKDTYISYFKNLSEADILDLNNSLCSLIALQESVLDIIEDVQKNRTPIVFKELLDFINSYAVAEELEEKKHASELKAEGRRLLEEMNEWLVLLNKHSAAIKNLERERGYRYSRQEADDLELYGKTVFLDIDGIEEMRRHILTKMDSIRRKIE